MHGVMEVLMFVHIFYHKCVSVRDEGRIHCFHLQMFVQYIFTYLFIICVNFKDVHCILKSL